ncbi:hypothetical protein H5410_062478 [Solanum commersonii]|uniref:Uncharacterized protein n=1 Tax=Solanum commersonii TaxID=4109 RepID=A0A9J5WCF8_SOLCO|nr:hypothetical protein H5410_062478 [Solanum commersonii]
MDRGEVEVETEGLIYTIMVDMRADTWVKLAGHVGTSFDGGKFRLKALWVPCNRERPFKCNFRPFTQLQNLGSILIPTKTNPIIQRFPNFTENESPNCKPYDN